MVKCRNKAIEKTEKRVRIEIDVYFANASS